MEKLQKPNKTDTVSYHHQKHLEMIYLQQFLQCSLIPAGKFLERKITCSQKTAIASQVRTSYQSECQLMTSKLILNLLSSFSKETIFSCHKNFSLNISLSALSV